MPARCSLPVSGPFSRDAPAWPKTILSGQAGFILLRGCGPCEPRQRLAVVPGHPLRRVLLQLLGAPLQLGEVAEWIDAVELAGVYQAHEQIPPLRSFPGLVKQRVLAMQNGLLQRTLDQIVIDG